MRPCIPATSAPSATGRQSRELQKGLACPKARPNRSRHRFAAPPSARRATAPERIQAPFSLDRARPVSLLARPIRGPAAPRTVGRGGAPKPTEWARKYPAKGQRAVLARLYGAGAVFAVHGNGAERTLRRRHGGASRWTSPPWPGRPIHAPRMLTDPPATAAWTCTGVRPARGRVLRWEWCGAGCPPPPGPGW